MFDGKKKLLIFFWHFQQFNNANFGIHPRSCYLTVNKDIRSRFHPSSAANICVRSFMMFGIINWTLISLLFNMLYHEFQKKNGFPFNDYFSPKLPLTYGIIAICKVPQKRGKCGFDPFLIKLSIQSSLAHCVWKTILKVG